eukprot:COSAG02_NODE_4984_length_4750_cov_5.407224_2_plen_72_part_00
MSVDSNFSAVPVVSRAVALSNRIYTMNSTRGVGAGYWYTSISHIACCWVDWVCYVSMYGPRVGAINSAKSI